MPPTFKTKYQQQEENSLGDELRDTTENVRDSFNKVLLHLEQIFAFTTHSPSLSQSSTQPLIGIAGVALKESARAVKELKKEQIEEVRSFHNPPTQVRQAGQ
eukprot:EG_transcript_52778